MKYKQEGDYLVGQPEKPKPTLDVWGNYQMKAYNDYLASLPRYKISGDKKVLEGRCDLELSVDFELKSERGEFLAAIHESMLGLPKDMDLVAVPIKRHWSDCAVHNEPAYPKGECDCGGFPLPVENKINKP